MEIGTFDGFEKGITFKPVLIRDMLFRALPHRPESSTVILGHQGAHLVRINLSTLRYLISQLALTIEEKKLAKGDTILLASFYASNELANALLFAAFTSLGIRVFIPIYPEADEFENWHQATQFKCVIMPSREILHQTGHEREQEAVYAFEGLCRKKNIPFYDAYDDFNIPSLLQKCVDGNEFPLTGLDFSDDLSVDDDAVIFTTSGTSGRSKLVVYSQGAFSICCQSWQHAGLFDPGVCGNPGFTPLFTHTIGIRHFINALWTGQPVCILCVDWFLNKPEEARYLLLQMKPGHIVGGPALFNMMLEFFRQFPEMKIGLQKNLKTLISIGAPYNLSTARQLKNALGLELFNAFGTTETQMIFLNKPEKEKNFDPESMGSPLPGVTLRLEETEEKGIFDLFVKSPYQCKRVIGEEKEMDWFASGDMVAYDSATGELKYAARKGTDFIKDDFGVKIPVNMLREYYPWLFTISAHVEWILMDKKPGLAALLFLHPSESHHSLAGINEQIKSRNELLQTALEPFEFTHRHIERFSTTTAPPPLTRKGTVSRKNLLTQFEDVITRLKNPYILGKDIESINTEEKTLLYKYADPRLASLLEALRLDVHFIRGEGDYLYYKLNGIEKKVLDLVGGFGAGLLGHNHPDIKKAMMAFLETDQPALNSQGSLHHYPALLARELNTIFSKNTGRYFKVQFGNTGAEAMEIALHHAYFEWWTWIEKKRDEQLQAFGSIEEIDVAAMWESNMKKVADATAGIIVINNCFHGYSSGARSLLNQKKQRYYFSGLLGPTPLHVNDTSETWKADIEELIRMHTITLKIVVDAAGSYSVGAENISSIIAAVFEPVRGEGGIFEANAEVADFLSQQKFPLIADEIQCGLGRTGTFPTYSKATYYLLGKSLGGGFEKISAVLIDDDHFKPTFPQYYTSTFANGELAAFTALTTLQVMAREQVAEKAMEKGDLFISKLHGIATLYPDIIAAVTGKGLMIGVHFNKRIGEKNTLLRGLFEHELLGYLFAGWLFHHKNIRVLPSLSKADSIRIEPSAFISEEGMNDCCEALNDLCRICRDGDMFALLKFLMNDDPYLDHHLKKFDGIFPSDLETPAPGALRVGFIVNFTAPIRELVLIERGLQQASDTGLRILYTKMQTLLEGKTIRLFSKNLMHGKVHFTCYLLPFDTAHLEVINRWGKKRFYNARIQETVNLLAGEGVHHISLGGHISIISGNGMSLAEPKNVNILTGNTMTVASSLYHLEQYLKTHQQDLPQPVVIAIAGATGNIGYGLAGCLDGEEYAHTQIILAGNNMKKLDQMRSTVFGPDRNVVCTTDLLDLQRANIIVSCTNTNDPLIFPHHIHPTEKVFIIDIAVPGSVTEAVKQMKNVEFCKDASTVYLPDDPDFSISSHTPAGKVFCCAAEVMLAALYDVRLQLKGHVHPESIKTMMHLAKMEGLLTKKEYVPSV